jgi:hypothetical protein
VSEFVTAVATGSDDVDLSFERGVLRFSQRFTAHVYRCAASRVYIFFVLAFLLLYFLFVFVLVSAHIFVCVFAPRRAEKGLVAITAARSPSRQRRVLLRRLDGTCVLCAVQSSGAVSLADKLLSEVYVFQPLVMTRHAAFCLLHAFVVYTVFVCGAMVSVSTFVWFGFNARCAYRGRCLCHKYILYLYLYFDASLCV